MPYIGPQGQELYLYEDLERLLALNDWIEHIGGSSTTALSAVTFFPERGLKSLEITVDGSNTAYRERDTGITIAPGEDMWIAFWVYIDSAGWDGTQLGEILRLSVGGAAAISLFPLGTNALTAFVFQDSGGSKSVTSVNGILKIDRWNLITVRLLRESTASSGDGGVGLYLNGSFIGQNFGADNFAKCNGDISVLIGSLMGVPGWDGFHAFFDEIMVADSYPQPYVPQPATIYPTEANRTVVTYRPTSDDSVALADYAVAELGVPRSLLIPLPNATATETAANYATFQSEVETDMLAWLALNTDAAAQTGTFATGFNVPNNFLDGGNHISAVSRLMNLDNAYSKQTANPLYQHSGRVTFEELRAQGMYCATALDNTGIGNAMMVIDNGVFANAAGRVSSGQNFQIDNATIYALFAVQKTRLTRVLSPPPAASAAVLIGALDGFETTAGEQRLIIDTNGAPVSVRNAGHLGTDINAGWPVGMSGLPARTDYSALFNTLDAGGSFAEACVTAWQYVDFLDLGIGIPDLQVDFPLEGYDVFRGTGSRLAIDYDNAVAHLRKGETSPSLVGLGHAADTTYYYAIRPTRAGVQTPDITCVVEFATDVAGDWTGNRPAAVQNVTLQQQPSAVIRVMWYNVPGPVAPSDFGIWYSTSRDVQTSGAPDAIVPVGIQQYHQHDLSLVDGQAYWIAVAARNGAVVGSAVEVGPLLADSTPPAAPAIYIQ